MTSGGGNYAWRHFKLLATEGARRPMSQELSTPTSRDDVEVTLLLRHFTLRRVNLKMDGRGSEASDRGGKRYLRAVSRAIDTLIWPTRWEPITR